MSAGDVNAAMGRALAEVLAPTLSRKGKAKCPKCGADLIVHVSVYPYTTVDVEEWGDGRRRVTYRGDLRDTKASMAAEVRDNYADVQVDERDELRCSGDDCDFWISPADLEFGRE